MRFEEPRFAPAGDQYLEVVFGDDASLELNFLALGLATAVRESGLAGIVDTNACYNSLLVEYQADAIAFADLKQELLSLSEQLGPTEELELESRLLYLPVMYLDPWTRACQEDYWQKISKREYDPDLVARVNGLEDAQQLVRVHSGTEHWVVTVGSIPGLPLSRALDPRCAIYSPKYNPARTWTPQGGIGVGGPSTSIYTVASPGGYNLVGRTPALVFDKSGRYSVFNEGGVLLRPADRIKFMPIGLEEFEYIERRMQEGTYEYNFVGYSKFSVSAYNAWVASLDIDGRF
ncbi:MAG: 5-oxoprolinase subunit B family protein [Gaiellaceae bacterium]